MCYFRLQMALAQYRHLPQEIESMRAVMEMRNTEIHELRRQKLEIQKQVGRHGAIPQTFSVYYRHYLSALCCDV